MEQKKLDLERKARDAKEKIKRQEETYALEKDQLDSLISMEMQEMEQRLITARDSGAEQTRLLQLSVTFGDCSSTGSSPGRTRAY